MVFTRLRHKDDWVSGVSAIIALSASIFALLHNYKTAQRPNENQPTVHAYLVYVRDHQTN